MGVKTVITARRKRTQKGIAVLVTTAGIFTMLPFVGLAIDAGFLYAVKAKLSAATDAAALAAARSLAKGESLAEQESSAQARARAFFDSNFPDGYLMTTNKDVSVSVSETAYRTRTVRVNSAVDAGLFFMRTLGDDFTTVRVTGAASRRDVNLVLVLDRSGSMQSTGSCEPMKAAAKSFVDQFANGRDRIGLITFSTGYNVAFEPSMNFKPDILTQIDNISCSGWTNSVTALWKAYEKLQVINEPGALNLLVFFTDGQPTALTASFPIKKERDTRYEIYNGWDNLVTMNPSPCADAEGDKYNRSADGSTTYSSPPWNPNWNPGSITGVMVGSQSSDNYGLTRGVYIPNTGGLLRPGRGCSFEGDDDRFRRDFAFIPENDAFGNSTRGYIDSYEFPSGPYAGNLRSDQPIALRTAAKNAADNAAFTIRNDSALSPVIYAIGLGDPNNPTYAPDQEFMTRVANDPASPVFNENQLTGMYVFAPDNSRLTQAFYQVASEILRISQ